MIAPPLLVGAALIAWGYAGNPFAVAVVLAAAFELLRAIGPRATPMQGREPLVLRVALIAAAALFVGSAATQKFPGAIYFALRGLPLALFPLAIMQVLAPGRMLGSNAVRAAFAVRARADETQFDATHAFAAAALVGAAATDPAARWFYPVAAAVVAWAILARAPRRLPAAALLALATALGFAIHTGLSALQSRIEDWSTELLQEFFAAGADPFRERTRIGDMGRIKLSDRIALRAIPAGPRPQQILLREAAFDTYLGGEWRVRRRAFTTRDVGDGVWRLGAAAASRALSIRRSVPGGEGVLALPAGTVRIDAIPGASLATLPTGAVRAQNLPGFVSLRIDYDPAADFAAPPEPADLEVPEVLRPALEQVLVEARAPRTSARAAEAAIGEFFAAHFGYTLMLSDGRGGTRTLRDFLLTERKGHCEYFATATALLLRQAGVPARYTVGYSAQEYSALENAFVVRDRHAHAWTSAWIDGHWVDVDNTPARWADFEEREARAWYGPLLDLASWAIDAVRRHLFESAWDARALAFYLAPFALALAALLLWRRRTRRLTPLAQAPNLATGAWRLVEENLARQGLSRAPTESARAFAERIEAGATGNAGLAALARGFYVARYDPASDAAQGARFADEVERWLSANRASARRSGRGDRPRG